MAWFLCLGELQENIGKVLGCARISITGAFRTTPTEVLLELLAALGVSISLSTYFLVSGDG